MHSLPERRQQMLAVHGPFIRQVVEASQTPGRQDDLELLLSTARHNGWDALVDALRLILGGRRDNRVLEGLDEEDQIIAEAVMRGLQDPATLPRIDQQPDAAMAAPGIAGMIQAAARGDAQALKMISGMAEQMSRVGGDMGRLAACIRPLINGERDPDKLCKGMTSRGESLMLGILRELEQPDVN